MSLLSKSKKTDASKAKVKKSDTTKSKVKKEVSSKKDSSRSCSKSRPKGIRNKNIKGVMDKITFKIRKPQTEDNAEQNNQEKDQNTLVHETVGLVKKTAENLMPVLIANMSNEKERLEKDLPAIKTKNTEKASNLEENQDSYQFSVRKEGTILDTGSSKEKSSDHHQLEDFIYENFDGAVFNLNTLGNVIVTGENNTQALSENNVQHPQDDNEKNNHLYEPHTETPIEIVTGNPMKSTAQTPKENTILFYHTSTVDTRFDKTNNIDSCPVDHPSLDDSSLKDICTVDDYESLVKTFQKDMGIVNAVNHDDLLNNGLQKATCAVQDNIESLKFSHKKLYAEYDIQNIADSLLETANEHVGDGKYVEPDDTKKTLLDSYTNGAVLT